MTEQGKSTDLKAEGNDACLEWLDGQLRSIKESHREVDGIVRDFRALNEILVIESLRLRLDPKSPTYKGVPVIALEGISEGRPPTALNLGPLMADAEARGARRALELLGLAMEADQRPWHPDSVTIGTYEAGWNDALERTKRGFKAVLATMGLEEEQKPLKCIVCGRMMEPQPGGTQTCPCGCVAGREMKDTVYFADDEEFGRFLRLLPDDYPGFPGIRDTVRKLVEKAVAEGTGS